MKITLNDFKFWDLDNLKRGNPVSIATAGVVGVVVGLAGIATVSRIVRSGFRSSRFWKIRAARDAMVYASSSPAGNPAEWMQTLLTSGRAEEQIANHLWVYLVENQHSVESINLVTDLVPPRILRKMGTLKLVEGPFADKETIMPRLMEGIVARVQKEFRAAAQASLSQAVHKERIVPLWTLLSYCYKIQPLCFSEELFLNPMLAAVRETPGGSFHFVAFLGRISERDPHAIGEWIRGRPEEIAALAHYIETYEDAFRPFWSTVDGPPKILANDPDDFLVSILERSCGADFMQDTLDPLVESLSPERRFVPPALHEAHLSWFS